MSKNKKKSKQRKPKFEIMFNRIERQHRRILSTSKSNIYLEKMDRVPGKEEEKKSNDEINLKDMANFEKIMNCDNKEDRLPSCNILIKTLEKLIPYIVSGVTRLPTRKDVLYNKLNVSIFISGKIGYLPTAKYDEKCRKRKLKWMEDIRIADDCIEFAERLLEIVLSIQDRNFKATAVENLLSTIIFLEKIRDGIDEMPPFKKELEYKQRIVKCEEYQIDTELIEKAYKLLERASMQ